MPGRRQSASEQVDAGLPRPARNGLGREQVADIQRARMLAAMVDVVAERGAGNVTVAHVVARSGVSRRTFYELFEDGEDCFLAAFDAGVGRMTGEVAPAYEQPDRWREKVRAGLVASLSFLDRERGLARLLIVESLAAGPGTVERRSRVLDHLVAVVEEGRRETKHGAEPVPLTAEGVVGAVLGVLYGRLVERSPGRLVELTNPLMGMIVLPYLGPATARKELARAVPRTPSPPGPVNGDPLRELGMRLTYRTVRVLMAVAEHPGSSNRAVADGAGIADQGQISKLLARLHGLGLIENTGAGSARGEPNAWTLTSKGNSVQTVIAQ
jgi:AcrR family transcriptional regulator